MPAAGVKSDIGMNTEIDRRVKKLLQPGHLCRVALEVRKNNNKGGTRVLCVVSPSEGKSQRESGLFILKTKLFSGNYLIRKVIPILSDFQTSITGDNEFRISWLGKRREVRDFMAFSAESLGVLLRTASRAHQIACSQGLDISSVASGASHDWLLGYGEDDHAKKHMTWLKNQPIENSAAEDDRLAPRKLSPRRTASDQSSEIPDDSEACDPDAHARHPEIPSANSDSSRSSHRTPFLVQEASNDPLLISFMTAEARQRWINEKLRLMQHRFVDRTPVTVRVCTWNVAAQFPVQALDVLSVREWLLPSGRQTTDILSIGLLETVELSANALFVNESSPESKKWEELIFALLDVPNKYSVVMSRQYVGVYHILFARKSLVESDVVKGPRSKCAGVGLMGLGNKGAVSFSVAVHSDRICFMCCHLAAGQSQVERRNNDAAEILRRTVFRASVEKGDTGGKLYSEIANECAPGEGKKVLSSEQGQPFETSNDSAVQVEDHDFAFCFGDLNYRIELSRAEVINALHNGDLDELRDADQLRKQMQDGRCFPGFNEAVLEFQPTYKYDLGTDEFDTSEKARAPAWCDRVLWRARHGGGCLTQTRYERHSSHLSDHKPVSATFEVLVKRVDQNKLAVASAQVSRQLDVADNECIPSAVVDINEVHFSNVEYRVPQTQVITVTNDGSVMVHFRFLPKGNQDSVQNLSKRWLSVRCLLPLPKTQHANHMELVQPKYGLLMPGESAELRLKIHVEDVSARAFAISKTELEDMLVLHVEGGNDTFIIITGNYLPSCYGSSILSLLSLRSPARYAANDARAVPTAIMPPIPREIWRLGGVLLDRGLCEERLFLVYGDESEVCEIRHCLDTGEPLRNNIQVQSIAEALVQLLRALPVPVIPPKFRKLCMECPRTSQDCWAALETMPEEHSALLLYIVALLRELLAHSNENKLNTVSLSLLMAAVLMEHDSDAFFEGVRANKHLIAEQEVMGLLLADRQ